MTNSNNLGWISVIDLVSFDTEDLCLTLLTNMIQEQSDTERQLWDERLTAVRGYPSNMQHTWDRDRRKRREDRHWSNNMVYSKIERLLGVDFVDGESFRRLIREIESNRAKLESNRPKIS